MVAGSVVTGWSGPVLWAVPVRLSGPSRCRSVGSAGNRNRGSGARPTSISRPRPGRFDLRGSAGGMPRSGTGATAASLRLRSRSAAMMKRGRGSGPAQPRSLGPDDHASPAHHRHQGDPGGRRALDRGPLDPARAARGAAPFRSPAFPTRSPRAPSSRVRSRSRACRRPSRRRSRGRPPPPVSGFDQTHLAALIAGAKPPKPKVAKAATKTASVVKTASAEKTPPAEKAAARR